MTGANLTVDTVVPYLLKRNLVSVAAIVGGDLEIVDAGRRNQNLIVLRRHGPSYLMKQPGEGERGTLATVRVEASFYEHCHGDPDAAEVRCVLPGFHSFDAERDLLIIEFVEGRPLWGQRSAAPNPEILAEFAAPLGESIGTIHRVFRNPVWSSKEWIAGLPAVQPWIFGAHRPSPEVFASISRANLQVLKLLQESALAERFDTLRAEWRSDTLIHNDLKGDNVLVLKGEEGAAHVRIVDWEMIQTGDAAWDVGSVFRDFLGYWLSSVPLSSDLTPEQMLEGAAWPLEKLHPATRGFWNAYLASVQLGAETDGSLLLRALGFGALRMAQGAYELGLGQQHPSNLAMAMLQLAANILTEPRAASLHLFGIPVPWRPERAPGRR